MKRNSIIYWNCYGKTLLNSPCISTHGILGSGSTCQSESGRIPWSLEEKRSLVESCIKISTIESTAKTV